jgi:hypothetical protein
VAFFFASEAQPAANVSTAAKQPISKQHVRDHFLRDGSSTDFIFPKADR